jgi:parvulin-like peptidyl-prolyl isomerase
MGAGDRPQEVLAGLAPQQVIQVHDVGPVGLAGGQHLVRIEARGTVQPARLDDVRATVVRDFNEERRSTANREIFEKLRERYQVVVDEAALTNAALTNVDWSR